MYRFDENVHDTKSRLKPWRLAFIGSASNVDAAISSPQIKMLFIGKHEWYSSEKTSCCQSASQCPCRQSHCSYSTHGFAWGESHTMELLNAAYGAAKSDKFLEQTDNDTPVMALQRSANCPMKLNSPSLPCVWVSVIPCWLKIPSSILYFQTDQVSYVHYF